jgi:RNA polymerase sigma factor (sigma-70 family)
VEVTDRVGRIVGGDAGLVRHAAQGDALAFEALVNPRLDQAFRIASAILGSEADAHDVVQESFIGAWKQLPRLRDPERFDAWLHRLIVNRCRDALRRRARSREIDLSGVADLVARDATDDVGEATRINAAFERLNVDQRYLLVMHHLQQMSVAELSRELGIPEGTGKWRLHAARKALEAALELGDR